MKQVDYTKTILFIILFLGIGLETIGQEFVHPGLSHKKSDLDRMKYMVEAKIEPFYSSYKDIVAKSTAKFTYAVKGNTDIWNYGVDRGWKDPWFNDDARAAYYCALRWYIEEDERYAEKAIEAIMAWTGLTNLDQKMSLTSAPIWLLIEAAELMRYTYDGWDPADIKKFEDMLVYPGYSNTTAPNGNYTWYWTAHMFDEARAGNQELGGIRTVAAIGVFLDNKRIYDRAMRYVSGETAREDDIPYARGPRIQGPFNADGSNEFSNSYSVPNPGNTEKYADWGYCGVLKYNIYPNGQNVESSRDQAHTSFSLGLLSTLGEIAWNQSIDFWGLLDSRILKGIEYTTRYMVTSKKSYPDQLFPWEPSTFIDLDELNLEEPRLEDASYDFIRISNRTKRNKSMNVSTIAREGFVEYHTWELPIAHYLGRGLKTEEDVKWTIRTRDYCRDYNGGYENGSTGQDYTGHGALLYHRPEGCYGDPISGFTDNGLPIFDMNILPCTIEAENYDYNPINAEGRIYHDVDATNTAGKYRTDQGVDISDCGEGGYQLSSLEAGEWLVYTIAIPESGYYNINLRYAAANGNGKVKISLAGEDITDEVSIPFGGEYSTGIENYADFNVAQKILLQPGVNALKIQISGASNSFVLNNISLNTYLNSTHVEAENYTEMRGVLVEANTSDVSGKSHVKAIGGGDYMEYDVYLPSTQNYNMEYRLASASAGTYSVWLNGEKVETFNYTATGGSDTWETQTSEISLPLVAGNHTFKIVAQSSGSLLNYIDFVKDETNCEQSQVELFYNTKNPGGIDLGASQGNSVTIIPGYSLQLIPTPEIGGQWSWTGPNNFTSSERILVFDDIQAESTGEYIIDYTNDCGTLTKDTFHINVSDVIFIEAENYNAMSFIVTSTTTDDGAGLKVSDISQDDFIEYEITVPFSGLYTVNYRVSATNASSFNVVLEDSNVETISFDATGGDELWSTIPSIGAIKLEKGVHTLKLVAATAGWNLNWIELELQDMLQPCNFPFIVEELEIDNLNQQWSSGLIDISCTDSVNLFMQAEGFGALTSADNLTVSYKVDGGEEIKLLENVGAVSATKLVETGIKGSYIEIIVKSGVDDSDKGYRLSEIKLNTPPVFNRIEVEYFDDMFGIQTETTSDVNGGENIGWVHNGDWMMFKGLDITGANSFSVRYSSPAEGNWIEMRLDDEEGPLIGKLSLNKTGNFKAWQTQGTNIIPTNGIYDVYLILKGGDGYLFNVNWFQFSTDILDINNDASLTSSVYSVSQENNTIEIPKLIYGTTFKANVNVATGATVELFKDDGVTPATFAVAGVKVVVTAFDGITQRVYTIDYPNGIKDVESEIASIFPNPANSVLNIQFKNSGAKKYQVMDMYGKEVCNGVFNNHTKQQINLSQLGKGIYLLKISGSNGISVAKFNKY